MSSSNIKIMSVTTLKEIYRNPFKKYKSYSESIDGLIYKQSITVDNVFRQTINLVETLCKYKKPFNPSNEQYLTEPILREIHKAIAAESKASDHIFQITLVSKSIKIFEWFCEDEVDKFIPKLNNYIEFYKQKAQTEIETLGKVHLEWFTSWMQTYEELSLFIISFFKNGILWLGTLNLPASQPLGDNPNLKKMMEHQALLKEINKDDAGQQVFNKHRSTTSNEITSFENKWKIEHQRGNHGVIINTAKKGDCIFLYNCEDCTVVIENAIESVNLDMCNKVTVLLRSVTRIEITDCQECNLHCFEKVIGLDLISCEKIGLYMSEKSLDTRITTTKSCDIKVNFPFEDGLYQTFAIPDHLVTKILPNSGVETNVSKI